MNIKDRTWCSKNTTFSETWKNGDLTASLSVYIYTYPCYVVSFNVKTTLPLGFDLQLVRIGQAMPPFFSRSSRSGPCLCPVEVISTKLDTWDIEESKDFRISWKILQDVKRKGHVFVFVDSRRTSVHWDSLDLGLVCVGDTWYWGNQHLNRQRSYPASRNTTVLLLASPMIKKTKLLRHRIDEAFRLRPWLQGRRASCAVSNTVEIDFRGTAVCRFAWGPQDGW